MHVNFSSHKVSKITQSQILADWKLIVIVLVIVGIAVLLLLIGEAIPLLRGVVLLIDDPENSDGRNVSIT